MVIEVLRTVFRQFRYLQIAVLVAALALSTAILLPNISIIQQVFSSTAISSASKIDFLWSLFGSLVTNFTPFSALYTVTVSLLLGVNIALLTFYIRRRQVGSKNYAGNTAGFFGVIVGAFGVGCAACGSLILSALLTSLGAGGLLLLLPFHGAEFGVLGVLLLGYSVYQLSKRIHDPLVCGV